MKRPSWPILYEDNHLLVVIKPAGLPTMGVAADRPSLVAQAKEYLKQKYQKPGNVYLGVVSRLDAPVTGVMVLARTSKAASRLTEQFRARTVDKTYWAMVEGRVQPDAGELVDWVRKDERHRRMHLASKGDRGAQQAQLSFRVLRRWPQYSLLEIELRTGRKHQIRLQFSGCGHPVIGDRKYNAKQTMKSGIALHARRLEFDHPTQNKRLKFTAPPPETWRRWGDLESF